MGWENSENTEKLIRDRLGWKWKRQNSNGI